MDDSVAYRNPFHRDGEVVIPKGFSYRYRGQTRSAGRTYTVRLWNAYDGYYDNSTGTFRAVKPSISWAGAGGYWIDGEITDELLSVNGLVPEENERQRELWKHYLARAV